MSILFRLSIGLSVAGLIAFSLAPFERPHVMSISLANPPVAPFLAVFCVMAVAMLIAVSAYGLLRFRLWALPLATIAAVLLTASAGAAILPGWTNPGMTLVGKAALVFSCAAWIFAVLLTRTHELKGRFQLSR